MNTYDKYLPSSYWNARMLIGMISNEEEQTIIVVDHNRIFQLHFYVIYIYIYIKTQEHQSKFLNSI